MNELKNMPKNNELTVEFNQNELINIINYILARHYAGMPPQSIAGLSGAGCCLGISLLWSFCMWLSTQPKTGKPRDDIDWFRNIIRLLNRASNFGFLEREYRCSARIKQWEEEIDKNWAEIERFIQFMQFLQQPQNYITMDENKGDIEQYFQYLIDTPVYQEGVLTGIYTEEELANKVLPSILKENENKFILVKYLPPTSMFSSSIFDGNPHATAIFNDYYIDPNSGAKVYLNYTGLAQMIFHHPLSSPMVKLGIMVTQFKRPPNAQAIAFKIYNFGQHQPNIYSYSRDLAPKYLAPEDIDKLPQDGALHEWNGDVSPLNWAIMNNDFAMVKYYLTTLKLNPNQPNKSGPYILKPLYIAARNGYYHIVELLLQNGAKLNSYFKIYCNFSYQNFETALHCAVRLKHIETVRVLLEHGADANVTGRHAIDMAVHTPLYDAVASGSIQLVEILLEHGAKLNIIGEFETPLQAAIKSRCIQMVEILLKHGADSNIAGAIETPLQTALRSGCIQIVEILLKHGANPNVGKIPPLFIAVRSGPPQLVEMLLDYRANPNVTFGGNTPLQVAGCTQIEEILLKHGAKSNIAYGKDRNVATSTSPPIANHPICDLGVFSQNKLKEVSTTTEQHEASTSINY